MVEDFVQLPADSTGKKMRTLNYTIGANSVEAEVVHIAGSGTTTVTDYSGALNVNISGGIISDATGNTRVTLYQGGSNATVGKTTDAFAAFIGLYTNSLIQLVEKSGIYDQMRSVDSISGGTQSGIGILAATALGFDYSGAAYRALAVGASGSNVLGVSLLSGTVSANISGQRGDRVTYNTYTLAWSGVVNEVAGSNSNNGGLIGFYNPGTVTFAEVVSVVLAYNSGTGTGLFYLARTSGGLLSGLAATPIPYSSANGASTVSGYMMSGLNGGSGIISASGWVPLDNFMQPAIVRTSEKRTYDVFGAQRPTARSGEAILFVDAGATGGFQGIALTWVEHN